MGAVSKDKAVSVSGPKPPPGSQKHVRLTVDELASHTARSENAQISSSAGGTPGQRSVKVSLNTPDRPQMRESTWNYDISCDVDANTAHTNFFRQLAILTWW